MKKGINASCFPDDLTLEEMFKWSSESGYTGLELMMSDLHDAEFSIHTDKEDLIKIKKLAERFGIELFSVATTLHWKYSLTDPDEAIREQGIIIARKMIEAADIFGAEMVLIVPGIVTPFVSYDEAYFRSQEAIKQLSDYAKEKDIRIGIENVWNKFLMSPMEMGEFVDQIDRSNVGVYFDVGNVLAFGYPEQWIRILAHRIIAVHVKDFQSNVGNINGFVPLLSGDVPWELVRESLEMNGYNGYIAPEIQPHSVYPQQLVQDTSKKLDFIFQWGDK